MYIPGTFSETDIQQLTGLIARHPLGLLISSGRSGLLASPIPFHYRLRDGKPLLVAHLAKANPHWKDLMELSECLVAFQGAENYVTPSWYPSKQTTHKVVPTWNYETVQVRGIPSIIERTGWLEDQVSELTDNFEQHRQAPWKVTDAPADFIASQLQAIVGLEINITEIKGKWKMSQNRHADDAMGVAQGMADTTDPHANAEVANIVCTRISAK